MAVYPRFMVRNAAGDYWSNEDGWVSYSQADIFDHLEMKDLQMPEGGEWVKMAESLPVVGVVGNDLKAKLGLDFIEKAGEMFHQNGLLFEFDWGHGQHVGNHVLAGQFLTAKLALPQSESKQMLRESCEALSSELAEAVRGLVPEGVLVRPTRLAHDHWNDMWNLDLMLVEATEEDFMDSKEVYGPGVPPDFALPEGASPSAERAWAVIIGVLNRGDDLYSGGHSHVFYTPEQWKARGEEYGGGSCLIVTHDGGAHMPYFAAEGGGHSMHSMMDLALRRAGFYAEQGTAWFSIIIEADPNEQLIIALEQRPRPQVEALDDEDEITGKEMQAPTEKGAMIRHLFGLAGLKIFKVFEEPADKGWGDLGRPQRIVDTIIVPDSKKPWTASGTATPELENFCRQIKSSLYEILGTDEIDYISRWKADPGAWEITWFVGDPDIQSRREIGEALDANIETERSWEPQDFWIVNYANRKSQTVLVVVRADENQNFLAWTLGNTGLLDGRVPPEAARPKNWFDRRRRDERGVFVGPANLLKNILPVRPTPAVGIVEISLKPAEVAQAYYQSQIEFYQKQLGNKSNSYRQIIQHNLELYKQELAKAQAALAELREGLGDDDLIAAEEGGAWKDVMPERYLTRQEVEQAMGELGVVSVLVLPGWHNTHFQGTWLYSQKDADAAELVRRIVCHLGLRSNRALIGYHYEPTTGTLDISIAQGLLGEAAGDEDSWKDVVHSQPTQQDIEAALVATGAQSVTVFRYTSKFDGFVCSWPGWTTADMYAAKDRLEKMGISYSRLKTIPNNESGFVVVIPRQFFAKPQKRRRIESEAPGLISRIMEQGGTVRKVQDSEQQGLVEIKGEWHRGQSLDALAEALAVDKSGASYDAKTGKFTVCASQTALQEASKRPIVAAAVMIKGRGIVASGSTHSEAMGSLLQQGYFGKIKSLEDLEDLGVRSNRAYNKIWNQVEIGFLTLRGEFVTREEASRMTGIEDVHGEDLAEGKNEGDDNRVAIVAVFREKSDEKACGQCGREKSEGKGYTCLVCQREYEPAKGEWGIAGGHAKEGEGIEVAAKREMKEETKLDLDDLTFIKKMPNEERNATVFVFGCMLPETQKAVAGDDAQRLKWLAIDDLPKLAFDNQTLIKEVAQKMGLQEAEQESSVDELPCPATRCDEMRRNELRCDAPSCNATTTTPSSEGVEEVLVEDEEDTGWKEVVGPGCWAIQCRISKEVNGQWVIGPHYARITRWKGGRAENWKWVESRQKATLFKSREAAQQVMEAGILSHEDARDWQDQPGESMFSIVNFEGLGEGRVQHMRQECGYDCGPACIKMVANALGIGRELKIADIVRAAGSDPVTGTDDKKMATGLQAAGVPFKVGEGKDAEALADALDSGSYIILRTLTRGIKHWIVVYDFDGTRFQVNDPWLGEISYTPEEIVTIWKPREYFYFEVPAKVNESAEQVQLVKIDERNWPGVEKAVLEVFAEHAAWVVQYIQAVADMDLSVAAMEGDQALGFYFLGRRTVAKGIADEEMEPVEDLSGYEQKQGVEGVALGLVSAARGQGIGSKLRDYPRSLDVDYIWGLQLESLNNLEHWLKRRRLVAKKPGLIATLQDFK